TSSQFEAAEPASAWRSASPIEAIPEAGEGPRLTRAGGAGVSAGGGGARPGDPQPALREGAGRLIGEALGDSGRGLGIVLGPEVEPGAAPGLAAEALREGLHRGGRVHLAPAAAAEDAPDQGGDRDHVGLLPGL